VFVGSGEPAGAWCAGQPDPSALRVCALVTDPLYGVDPGSLDPQPRLARSCASAAGATTWTCTLRAGVTFQDGSTLDAGDVLASFAAAWDPSSPVHAAMPGARWDDWLALFGAFLEPASGGG
jgi:ABC-type transport system substrate-binding protein